MIKYFLRKPLLPILFMLLFVFEVLFMGIISRGIERDMKTVEEMYDKSVITYTALPESNGDLILRPHFTDSLAKLEEVESAYGIIYCPYSLRKPERYKGLGMLMGTSDICRLSKNYEIKINYSKDYKYLEDCVTMNRDNFPDWYINDNEIPCIVDEAIMGIYGLSLGESFVIAPYDGRGADSPNAPEYTLYICGAFKGNNERMDSYSIIVPECIFLEAPSAMYNATLQEKYFCYSQFEIRIKSSYNRRADDVEEKMQDTFKRANVLVHSDVRILKRAVRPVEQRLRIQKTLEKPMKIAFSLAIGLLSVLMAIGIQNDIFLFVLFGEARVKTFIKTLLNLSLIVLGSALIALIISSFVLGIEWVPWLIKYLIEGIVICVLSMVIPTFFFCNKNLVMFYQSKEA